MAVVCDNDGYAVINRLQTGQGGAGFNNMYADVRTSHAAPPRTDFAKHAASLGCAVFAVDKVDDLADAYRRAREAALGEHRPAVVVIRTHPSAWTDAGAWWEVAVPATSHRPEIDAAHGRMVEDKARQVRYL